MVAKFAAAPSTEGNTPVSEISRGAQRVVRDLIMVILPSSTCHSFPAPPLPKLASNDPASKPGVARSTVAFLPIAPSSLPHRRRPTNPFFLPPDEKFPRMNLVPTLLVCVERLGIGILQHIYLYAAAALLGWYVVYQRYFHPLSQFPGPCRAPLPPFCLNKYHERKNEIRFC